MFLIAIVDIGHKTTTFFRELIRLKQNILIQCSYIPKISYPEEELSILSNLMIHIL